MRKRARCLSIARCANGSFWPTRFRDQKFPNWSWVSYTDEGDRLYGSIKPGSQLVNGRAFPSYCFMTCGGLPCATWSAPVYPAKWRCLFQAIRPSISTAGTTSWRIGTLLTLLLEWTSTPGPIKARQPKGAEPKLKEPGRAGTLLGTPHDEKQRTGAKLPSKLSILKEMWWAL